MTKTFALELVEDAQGIAQDVAMTTVGETLKAAREAAGLSQDALAALAGLTGNGIGNIESGKTRKPYGATLNAIAKALGFDAWVDVDKAHRPIPQGELRRQMLHRQVSNIGAGIPVLAQVPATQYLDGEVFDAYGHEEPLTHLPAELRGEWKDERLFGLIVEGDSMAPDIPHRSWVVCSPKQWQDFGFVEGEVYAIRLDCGDTTIKRVHLIENGEVSLDLIPSNPQHPTRRVAADEVALAALVCGVYSLRTLPRR